MNRASIVLLIGLAFESLGRPRLLCSKELTIRHLQPEDSTHCYIIYPEKTTKFSDLPLQGNWDGVPTTKHPTDSITASQGAQGSRLNPFTSVIRHENMTTTEKTSWALPVNIPSLSPILYYSAQLAVDPIFMTLILISFALFLAAHFLPER
jgi:hypothetical protein